MLYVQLLSFRAGNIQHLTSSMHSEISSEIARCALIRIVKRIPSNIESVLNRERDNNQ